MKEIGIGIVGGGYMGKAHAVAMSAVGAVFNTNLRPRLEMVCGASHETSKNIAMHMDLDEQPIIGSNLWKMKKLKP